MKKRTLIVSLFLMFFWVTNSSADRIRLHLALLPDFKHIYFHELLDISLKAAGHNPIIVRKGERQQHKIWEDLLSDKLTLHWFLQTPKRDELLIPVKVGITDGLIGQRILFIPKGNQSMFNGISSLDQFRSLGLTAALGRMWFDAEVWDFNELKVTRQDGDWRQIYAKVATKASGYDYFPRGANEIIDEALQQPSLSIEQNLMLVYDRDFYFYLSKANARYQRPLEEAMSLAKSSGIMKNLIRKHWAGALSILRYDERKIINLSTP